MSWIYIILRTLKSEIITYIFFFPDHTFPPHPSSHASAELTLKSLTVEAVSASLQVHVAKFNGVQRLMWNYPLLSSSAAVTALSFVIILISVAAWNLYTRYSKSVLYSARLAHINILIDYALSLWNISTVHALAYALIYMYYCSTRALLLLS